MLLAQVMGNVWGARQADGLRGFRLLLVRPLTAVAADEAASMGGVLDVHADAVALRPSRDTKVVVDRLGAGPGELVLIAHGSRCRDITLGEDVATKEVTVAIVDRAMVRLEPPASRRGGQP